MIAPRDWIRMRWDLRADRIADEIAVKCDGPRCCEQEHLVVAGALAPKLPTEGLLQVAKNTANDC